MYLVFFVLIISGYSGRCPGPMGGCNIFAMEFKNSFMIIYKSFIIEATSVSESLGPNRCIWLSHS